MLFAANVQRGALTVNYMIVIYWQTTKALIILNRYSKTCLKGPLKKETKIGFQDQSSLNGGQMYCRMLHGEHSAILSTFIKLPFVMKTFVLSVFEWPLRTGFTVHNLVLTFIVYRCPKHSYYSCIHAKGVFSYITVQVDFYDEQKR